MSLDDRARNQLREEAFEEEDLFRMLQEGFRNNIGITNVLLFVYIYHEAYALKRKERDADW